MTRSGMIVLALLILNAVFAFGYLIYGLLRVRKVSDPKEVKKEKIADIEITEETQEETVHDGKKTVMCFVTILLCPVVAPLFLIFSFLFQKIFFHTPVDLDDVIFNKDKVDDFKKGDDERERNIIPLEEALSVTDKQNLRTLMLSILQGNMMESLSVVAQALNSEDSETAHYAASALRDELNDFRSNVDRLETEIAKKDARQLEYAKALLRYLNVFVSQNVCSAMEQVTYVDKMEEVGNLLCAIGEDELDVEYFEWIAMALLHIKEYDRAKTWALKAKEMFDMELTPYTCLLKIYFEQGDREQFFATMDEFKRTQIPVDHATMELMRVFS